MKLSPTLFLPLLLSLRVSALPRGNGEPNISSNVGERGLISDLAGLIISELLAVGEVLDQIDDYITLHSDLEVSFPGLQSTLKEIKNNETDAEACNRQLLQSIRLHPAFITAYNELDEDLQTKLTAFIDGESASNITKRGFWVPPSPAAKQHFKRMEDSGATLISRNWLNSKRGTSPVIYEDAAKTIVMTVYVSAEFENWGLTVSNTPAYTFVPTTVLGLQNLMVFAIANNKRVRAAGYRHTWSSMFSEDDQIFVSMLNVKTATFVPDPSSLIPNSADNASNEFKQIELATEDIAGYEGKKRLARVGASVTNEEFRRWAINNGWTLPLNVIMVEITLGGSNAPICHGAGITHKTLSDLVRQIEYVDANGVFRAVSDPEQLKAAAGAFGLLGVVTHVTFELDIMTYAEMKPLKQDVNLAIPPPTGFDVPSAIRKNYTDAELEAARVDFVSKAETGYYAEWFWFPYQQKAWVNCWNNTEDSTDVIDYPTYPDLFLQWVSGWLGGVINDDVLFRAFPGQWQAVILGSLAMLALPPNGPLNTDIKTYLIDGLHFRRGVQNMRVRDTELQIPIPPLASDPTKPDWSVVQQAWWDAIAVTYDDSTAPMRITLELRIMSSSDIIMAPQTNNTFGTASIEVLTSMAAADEGVWDQYVQKIIDKWMSYERNGAKLNVRPHWAKEWESFTFNGLAMADHLKQDAYKDEIPKFTSVLAEIGATQNWTLSDIQTRFSNSLLDYIFFT
ncbi:hypothetical protein RUND412_011088 [Rhizina undulata]